MNCHDAYLWMLEADEPAVSPPVEVAEHVRGCAKCRRRQQRVLSLLATVHTLPGPPENPQIRTETMTLVRQTPVGPREIPPPTVPFRLRFPRKWLIPAAISAAAALLVFGLLGVLLYHLSSHQETAPSKPDKVAEPVPRDWNDGDLRTHLLEHTLNLAESKSNVDQFDALAEMAADLEHESLAKASQGDNNADLMRLAVMYERIIDDGVLPHWRLLSAEERQQELPWVAAELLQEEKDTQQTAARKPVLAEPLRRVSQAAGRAARLLNNPNFQALMPKKAEAPPPNAPLVDTLVATGLVLAGENDPLRRADICTDVADNVLHTIMEASQRGSDEKEMNKLGTYLGAVIRRAVNGNLDRVEMKTADPARRAECERIRQRAMSMMTGFHTDMENAPPPQRSCLEHAFQASRFFAQANGPPHFFKDFRHGGDRHKGRH